MNGFYVARDKNGKLFLYNHYPNRQEKSWFPQPEASFGQTWMEIDKDMFPLLKWEDDPVAVIVFGNNITRKWK